MCTLLLLLLLSSQVLTSPKTYVYDEDKPVHRYFTQHYLPKMTHATLALGEVQPPLVRTEYINKNEALIAQMLECGMDALASWTKPDADGHIPQLGIGRLVNTGVLLMSFVEKLLTPTDGRRIVDPNFANAAGDTLWTEMLRIDRNTRMFCTTAPAEFVAMLERRNDILQQIDLCAANAQGESVMSLLRDAVTIGKSWREHSNNPHQDLADAIHHGNWKRLDARVEALWFRVCLPTVMRELQTHLIGDLANIAAGYVVGARRLAAWAHQQKAAASADDDTDAKVKLEPESKTSDRAPETMDWE